MESARYARKRRRVHKSCEAYSLTTFFVCTRWTHDDYRLRDGSETQANRFKVTKGGSMDTELYYLRSANRAGALPLDRSWYIGFRVVMTTEPLLSMTASTVERVQPKEEGRKEEEGQLSETGFARPLRYVNTMSLVRPPYSVRGERSRVVALSITPLLFFSFLLCLFISPFSFVC